MSCRKSEVSSYKGRRGQVWLKSLLALILAGCLCFGGLLAAVLLPAARRLRPALLPLLLPALGYAIHALFGISQSLVSRLRF